MTPTELTKMMAEAERFITACYLELGKSEQQTEDRLRDIGTEIRDSGTYVHTEEELRHGAKMAWRNSNRCIGRLFWNTLHVIDARSANTAKEVSEYLIRHIRIATNGGKIRPVITVLRPAARHEAQIRILNHQLIRYAGYETDGGTIGDPNSVELTRICIELGWKGKGTPYDVLPLVVQIGNGRPEWFKIPEDLVLEVPIIHPEFDAFATLNLKWYAVPIVSDMRLEIGGISFTAAPFNGWYMGTEIGARNLADESRYNMLPCVAEVMGLDTTSDSMLWRDRALVELNLAVLHSFKQEGVTIVDHHTASRQFQRFEENERISGRDVTGNWAWLIPPISPATTHIFHSSYSNATVTPNFFYQTQLREGESD